MTIPLLTGESDPNGSPLYALTLAKFYIRGRGDIPRPNIVYPYIAVDYIEMNEDGGFIVDGDDYFVFSYTKRWTLACLRTIPSYTTSKSLSTKTSNSGPGRLTSLSVNSIPSLRPPSFATSSARSKMTSKRADLTSASRGGRRIRSTATRRSKSWRSLKGSEISSSWDLTPSELWKRRLLLAITPLG